MATSCLVRRLAPAAPSSCRRGGGRGVTSLVPQTTKTAQLWRCNNTLQLPLPSSTATPLLRCFIHQHSQQKRIAAQKKKAKLDPFRVLGLSSKDTTYVTVKQTFLQIAMQHHPDTTKAASEEERDKHRDIFVAARKAFEDIVPGPGGLAVLRSEADQALDEEELNEWFHQESGGLDMPFMDIKTRQEVSRVMDEIGGGLDRDGGMWTLARMVANDVKQGGDGASILRLEAGNVRSREIDGILRRKRKR